MNIVKSVPKPKVWTTPSVGETAAGAVINLAAGGASNEPQVRPSSVEVLLHICSSTPVPKMLSEPPAVGAEANAGADANLSSPLSTSFQGDQLSPAFSDIVR